MSLALAFYKMYDVIAMFYYGVFLVMLMYYYDTPVTIASQYLLVYIISAMILKLILKSLIKKLIKKELVNLAYDTIIHNPIYKVKSK